MQSADKSQPVYTWSRHLNWRCCARMLAHCRLSDSVGLRWDPRMLCCQRIPRKGFAVDWVNILKTCGLDRTLQSVL